MVLPDDAAMYDETMWAVRMMTMFVQRMEGMTRKKITEVLWL